MSVRRIVGLHKMPRNTLEGAAQSPHRGPRTQEDSHGLQRQRQEEVGGWGEAMIVAAFLVFAVFVFGLATLAGK